MDKVALPVLLGQALAIDRLVIDGMAVGIDDDHAVFHRGRTSLLAALYFARTMAGPAPPSNARCEGVRNRSAGSKAQG
jgi:hypothetical protein